MRLFSLIKQLLLPPTPRPKMSFEEFYKKNVRIVFSYFDGPELYRVELRNPTRATDLLIGVMEDGSFNEERGKFQLTYYDISTGQPILKQCYYSDINRPIIEKIFNAYSHWH